MTIFCEALTTSTGEVRKRRRIARVKVVAVVLFIAYVMFFNYGGCLGIGNENLSGSSGLTFSIVTNPVTNVTQTTATLNGTVNPNGVGTNIYFEYSRTTIYSNYTNYQYIGAGMTDINVSANLTGLSINTTYNFRIKAVRDGSTYAGPNLTFTTLGRTPVCVTGFPTNVSYDSAQLNGTVNANTLATTAYFNYGLPPAGEPRPDGGTTSYGSTTLSSPIGSGTSNFPVTTTITGLLESTQYNFRVVGTNLAGTIYGNNRTFTTLESPRPICVTKSATNITANSARLNGTVNPNAFPTNAYFGYGLNGSYNITTISQAIGSGTATIGVTADISGLSSNAEYSFRIVGTSSAGENYGNNRIFTTGNSSGSAPTCMTDDVDNITFTSAILYGTVIPNGVAATAWFGFRTSATPPTYTITTTTQSIGSGTVSVAITATAGSLTPDTSYNFRVVGTNSGGTTNGNNLTFTTLLPLPATCATNAATNVTYDSAQLNATVNPKGSNTTAYFQWGLSASPAPSGVYGNNTTTQNLGSGLSAVTVSETITGLSANNVYNFRIRATNSVGTTLGANRMFGTWLQGRSTLVLSTPVLFTTGTFNNTITTTGAADVTLKLKSPVFSSATGGTITYSGGYTIHTFTSSGTFTPNSARNVEVLVVAGGGGGASGGGGAGGLIYNSSYAVAAGSYTVTVGAGGAGGVANGGAGRTNGGNSIFSSLTAIGGGAGGPSDSSTGANAGGSGGGGGATSSVICNGGSGTGGQGNNGGTTPVSVTPFPCAGGGGAGAPGSPPVNATTSGGGGVGLSNSISGNLTFYAGGGGGSTWNNGTHGTGGNGGGGNGGYPNGTSGAANTGGGGGGGAGGAAGSGGNGGSGIVIVRYLTPTPGVWQFSRPISVTNSTASILTDYQISVTLTTAILGNPYSNIKTDGSDIRFTGSDGVTELSYWIETWNNTGNSTVWVKIPSVPTGTSTIYMYYGNTSATSSSNGTNTFVFFDDFSLTNIDTNKWTVNAVNTITSAISNGKLRITNGTASVETYWIYDNTDTGSQHQMKNITSFDNISIDWVSYAEDTGDLGEVGIALVDASNLVRAYLHYRDGNSGVFPYRAWICETTGNSETYTLPESKRFSITRNGTTVGFYIDDVLKGTGSLTGTPSKIAIAVGAYGGNTFRVSEIDDVRVRKYASPEPTVTAPGTEQYGASGSYTSAAITPTGVSLAPGGVYWGVLTYTYTAPANTIFTVDVLNSSNNAILATNVPSGINLSQNYVIFSGITGIKLRGNFSNIVNTATPTLSDWGVAWTDDTPPPAPIKPVVVTTPATAISTTSAVLNAIVNPNGGNTTAWFGYGISTTPITYPLRINALAVIGIGTSNVAVSATINSLTINTAYNFRCVATNSAGTTNGGNLTFTTLGPPICATNAADNITFNSARLNGTVNPNGLNVTSCYFDYGTTTFYGISATVISLPGNGSSPISVTANVLSLSATTTYNFRVVATNAGGTTNGLNQTFNTSAILAPICTTNNATNIVDTTATLNGTVNPNGFATTAYFQWGTTTSYGNTTTSQNIGSGTTNVAVTANITGLTAGALYNFRVVAINAGGTTNGNNLTFTTTITFNYTGGVQTFVVPAGITSISVDCRGAKGGANGSTVNGGNGARVQTTLSVTPGQTLYIYVGGQGTTLNAGYNGGGTGASGIYKNGGGGGGASDIRQGGTALTNRVVVAGGGGGGGGYSTNTTGGAGGQTNNNFVGTAGNASGTNPGQGGTNTAGGAGGSGGNAGSLGQGGNAISYENYGGAGGGGGFYGGGSGGNTSGNGGGGGGGSSYGGGTYTSGYQSGNGQIIISIP
ncbi:MAG: DUF2341 domain-containing protein [Planctomycetota bacterium]